MIKRMFGLVTLALVAMAAVPGCMAEDETPAPEATAEVSQAAGSCPESFGCATYNGGSMLKSVYLNCDAQGDTINMTCSYWNGSSVIKTPSATNCNECAVSTSQGPAVCGQTKLTTYANGTCSAGLRLDRGEGRRVRSGP